MFKKALALEYMAPNFNSQTNHSITAWMTNCEEKQHVTAWFICLNKCFVQFSKNDGSDDWEWSKEFPTALGIKTSRAEELCGFTYLVRVL